MAAKSSDDRDKQLRNELDELLKGINPSQFDNSQEEIDFDAKNDENKEDFIPDIPKVDIGAQIRQSDRTPSQSQAPLNIAELDKRFKTQAKNLIESMYDFYFAFGVIDKPEYIEKKKSFDTLNMSNTLFQLKMTKVVLARIMEDIDAGNTNPKVIEAFCNLNSQMSELTRTQANYMIFLEETYKKAKIEAQDYNMLKTTYSGKKNVSVPVEDIEPQQQEQTKELPQETNQEEKFFITSDPLILIEEISKNKFTEEEIKEQRSDYLKERGDVSRYVNHANKNDLVEEYDVDATTIRAEDEMDDDSDILQML